MILLCPSVPKFTKWSASWLFPENVLDTVVDHSHRISFFSSTTNAPFSECALFVPCGMKRSLLQKEKATREKILTQVWTSFVKDEFDLTF